MKSKVVRIYLFLKKLRYFLICSLSNINRGFEAKLICNHGLSDNELEFLLTIVSMP